MWNRKQEEENNSRKGDDNGRDLHTVSERKLALKVETRQSACRYCYAVNRTNCIQVGTSSLPSHVETMRE
jgi:hypothetical protein